MIVIVSSILKYVPMAIYLITCNSFIESRTEIPYRKRLFNRYSRAILMVLNYLFRCPITIFHALFCVDSIPLCLQERYHFLEKKKQTPVGNDFTRHARNDTTRELCLPLCNPVHSFETKECSGGEKRKRGWWEGSGGGGGGGVGGGGRGGGRKLLVVVVCWFYVPAACSVYLRGGSVQTLPRDATLGSKLQIQLAMSPRHGVLTPGQPVPALTV